MQQKDVRITVGITGAQPIAYLDSKVSSDLKEVFSSCTISLEGCNFGALEAAHIGSAKHRRDTDFKLDISVYGLNAHGDLVGKLLSKRNLFLQNPPPSIARPTYNNPHIWAFDDIPDIDIWLAERMIRKPGRRNVEPQQGWIRVLDQLSDSYAGTERTILDTSGLRTDLLKYVAVFIIGFVTNASSRHQQAALVFMTNRETGNLNEALRYWKPGVSEEGTVM